MVHSNQVSGRPIKRSGIRAGNAIGLVDGQWTPAAVLIEPRMPKGVTMDSFKQPKDTATPYDNERWADQVTASIALRTRIRHPKSLADRADEFHAEIQRLPQPWSHNQQRVRRQIAAENEVLIRMARARAADRRRPSP